MQDTQIHKQDQQPRLADSSSLWNFTPSPGWNEHESLVLKMLLMDIGVGRWVQILDTGLLPGKLIQQLNGQTQRLLGTQSIAAYSALKVNVDMIRADNNNRKDAERKAGLIINEAGKLSREDRLRLQAQNQQKYRLTQDDVVQIEQFLKKEQSQVDIHATQNQNHFQPVCRVPIFELLGANPKLMSKSHKIYVLKALYQKMELLQDQFMKFNSLQIDSNKGDEKGDDKGQDIEKYKEQGLSSEASIKESDKNEQQPKLVSAQTFSQQTNLVNKTIQQRQQNLPEQVQEYKYPELSTFAVGNPSYKATINNIANSTGNAKYYDNSNSQNINSKVQDHVKINQQQILYNNSHTKNNSNNLYSKNQDKNNNSNNILIEDANNSNNKNNSYDCSKIQAPLLNDHGLSSQDMFEQLKDFLGSDGSKIQIFSSQEQSKSASIIQQCYKDRQETDYEKQNKASSRSSQTLEEDQSVGFQLASNVNSQNLQQEYAAAPEIQSQKQLEPNQPKVNNIQQLNCPKESEIIQKQSSRKGAPIKKQNQVSQRQREQRVRQNSKKRKNGFSSDEDQDAQRTHISKHKMKQIMGMGYSHKMAQDALEMQDNNLPHAIDWLIQNIK